MGERVRELYGLVRSPDNSILVVCGGAVVVAAARNVAATIGVAVVVGAVAVLVVWVQRC